MGAQKAIHIVLCGAGPVRDVGKLVTALQRWWSVDLIATQAAMDLIDVGDLEARTGKPIRTSYSPPGAPRPPHPDAYIVAPATANTINKLANGIADTYVTSLLNEGIGTRIPTIILPSVKRCVADRAPFQRSVQDLRREGVVVLLGGEDGIHPTNDSSKDGPLPPFPWWLAAKAVEAVL